MADSEPKIKIKVDSDEAKRELKGFNRVIESVEDTLEDLGDEGRKSGREISTATDKGKRGMRGFGRVVDVVKRKMGGFIGSIKRMVFNWGTAVTAFASGIVLKQIIDATLQMESFRTQIQGATNDWNATDKAIEGVRKQAMFLGRDLRQSLGSYSNILPTLTPSLGTEGATELFNQAQIIATGKDMSEGQAQSFMSSIGRTYSQGQFDSRVWTQLAVVIGDMEPFAKAVGKTTSELKTGKLSLDEFNRGIHALAKDQIDEATNVAGNASSAFRRLRTSIWDTFVSIGESGLVQSLADLANRFAAFTQTDAFDTWLSDTVSIVGDVLKQIGTGILNFIRVIQRALLCDTWCRPSRGDRIPS